MNFIFVHWCSGNEKQQLPLEIHMWEQGVMVAYYLDTP